MQAVVDFPSSQIFTQEEVREKKLNLSFEVASYEGATVLRCQGRIVFRDEALALSAKVADLLPQSRQVVIDLSGVETIDSAGLGELVVAFMSGQITSIPVKLASPNRLVRKILEITNLNSVIEVYEQVKDAVTSRKSTVVATAQGFGAGL
ncbi:MAG TPA: STAS domain-containing protein [Terriglobales bacterium]